MAKRGSLSEFQAHLARRLAGASEQSAAGLLGVLSGSDYWLLNLSDSGEVVPLPGLTSVPLTRPWFVGIANIRGNLYSVTDFSAFQGKAATPQNASSRLLLIGARHGNNAALRAHGINDALHHRLVPQRGRGVVGIGDVGDGRAVLGNGSQHGRFV